ncbi:hypothetical protein TPA0910_11540 [Streptomyces hygroscopicus subsp. sporocinereus]|uniref:Uncharacterized protein n=1 Tax=Streptomyces hygroscopicus TaxID=1912 RepID=A0ABQ3TUV6_STRHY|nr:hypothetical protein TPA0910_11540 [Streptomyces hygroscopicus]
MHWNAQCGERVSNGRGRFAGSFTWRPDGLLRSDACWIPNCWNGSRPYGEARLDMGSRLEASGADLGGLG